MSFVHAVRSAEKKTLKVGKPVEMTTLSKGAFMDAFLDSPKGFLGNSTRVIRQAGKDYQAVLFDLQKVLTDALEIIKGFDGNDAGGKDLGLNLSPLQKSIEKAQSSIEGFI